MKDMVGGCCVCSDERGWDENPLVYCDGQGCNVAVHQACYGIVTVPSGPWYCQKCDSQERSTKVRCELCPFRDGALKRTDQNGWTHVVCALYIPEVRFGNVTTMEPIIISHIPAERFGKRCYICEEHNKGPKATAGACMQCNKQGCKQFFHVTCAQMHGLLCEEAGTMQDNVKYCGYCQHHYSKLKRTSNLKIIPPFRPVPNPAGANQNQDSSPEHAGSSNARKDSSPGPDSSKGPLKKKLSSSSSASSTSSKSSNSGQHASSMPRIAPSNLFSSSSFSSSISKSDRASDHGFGNEATNLSTTSPSKDDSYVLKSDDLKSHGPSCATSGDPKKFNMKTSDIMTVKLNDVLAASLDRPIVDHPPPKEKVSPPDIKPHVTLTPIPMRSSDKLGDPKSDIGLFRDAGQAKTSINAKVKEAVASVDKEKGSTDYSSVNSKRSRYSDFESPPRLEPHPPPPSTDGSKGPNEKDKTSDSSKIPALKDETKKPGAAALSLLPVEEPKPTDQPNNHNHAPPKRGPGRPVKRRSSGPSRDEELGRLDDPQKKKPKRGGRRGGSSNSNNYNRREENIDHTSTYGDDEASDKRKKSSTTPKKPEEVTPTLSQLKAQMDAKKAADGVSSSMLPAHMFGNALNPASSMAQRMVDTLSQEIETMAEAGVTLDDKIDKPIDKLVGIPLPRFSSSASNGLTNGNGSSSVVNGVVNGKSSSGTGGKFKGLEDLLERQWEHGSQFLMEQAQHMDIAHLLSALNQLKQENRDLEEHITNLMQRKDNLQALNARLSVPFGPLSATNGPSPLPVGNNERLHEGLPMLPSRPNHIPNDIGGHHGHPQPHPMPPQLGSGNRSLSYSGNSLPVPVVVSSHSHTTPHNMNQPHGPR